MDPIADLPALQAVLEGLAARKLVVFLTPPGVRRGVVVTHGLYPPDELEQVRRAQSQAATPEDDAPPSRTPSHRADPSPEITALLEEVRSLRGRVEMLAEDVNDLKSQLGVLNPMEAIETGPSRRVISLVPLDGREPPADLDEAEAEGAWAAVSAPWHPSILARIDALPQVVDAGVAQLPEPGDVLVLAAGAWARLPSGDLGWPRPSARRRSRAWPAASNSPGSSSRGSTPSRAEEIAGEPDGLVLDFFALGTARRMLKELTTAMGHIDCLD